MDGEMGRNDSHGRDLIANGPDSLHYVFPDPREEIGQTCTPKGRCKVGWVVSQGGRESFDVWLEVSTGLVKLVPRPH